jgi:catechol 2,3-dioxygenase-like lactoylglutathione lyase family enzyme
MSVQVYGCNHVAIEVDDIKKAIAFYQDVFNLEKLNSGEGDAFFKLGEHQFLAIFEVKKLQPGGMRHFGIMVRDEEQIAEVREKITGKYGLKLEPPFRCDFHDPWGNRIQVVDLHDESLIWLLPYREVQKAGPQFPFVFVRLFARIISIPRAIEACPERSRMGQSPPPQALCANSVLTLQSQDGQTFRQKHSHYWRVAGTRA